MDLRQRTLILAEALDALRVVPRTMIVCYGWIVLNLFIWFKSIPTYVQEKCDPSVLLLAINKGMPLTQAKSLACTVVDVVGGPTASQTAFVTTIIGLSTAIFGLYANSGRKWDGWNPFNPTNPVQQPSYPQEYNYGPTVDGPMGPGPVVGPVIGPVAPKTQINVFGKTEETKAPEDHVVKVPDEDTPPRP